ncbi:FliI/YscN family ATPase [Colwellia sp. 4_MG-2023]|jgi:flagellum-specific ATP synthase|uniref:FliI/YscN family ATPase n=1 Tax=unclassified Colwellia TaxID=196834 RepID=UPI001C0A54B4|nr:MULTISPECIES: FliI/YscN family ATPase [unclassified Colwellia]MBU2926121.1 FliI/YscN family ATPase [Colwellia sp. C2M11]MDO6508319.1 FliI/YscN family ATPase [Colwellia sp. 5_MG-2023]MDO6556938.1 FliI/YscN family ATPase [Colwellia sp. 4_MG-2023]MDO6652458.1 FliI/YscN family ATPase [Colwellia sp. 3_MG-2023]MDO6665667.1 FliI/YscN family ATPase [Colwellia sp. 2_MG-2023]
MTSTLLERLGKATCALTSPPLLQSYGRLVRVNGLTLTAVGGVFTMGKKYQVEGIDGTWYDVEVIGFHESEAYLMPLNKIQDLYAGARVRVAKNEPSVCIDERLLGRVLDAQMNPIDDLGPLAKDQENVALKLSKSTQLNPLQRKGVTEPLDVGIRAINSLFTVGKGQRLGLFAGSGVGKSKLLGMMTKFTSADVVIVSLVGERGWEVKEFIEQSLGPEGLKKAIIIASPADDSPLLRVKAAELSHQLAIYFRDKNLNVLLLMDSLTRYAQAYREIGLSVGELPASKGYPPSVYSKLTQLVESSGNSEKSQGSMTAIYTVLAEGDDQQDPIADNARAILDGHIVLDRTLAEKGHYPAINIGASISRVMPNIVNPSQLQNCYTLKKLYSRYLQVHELIPLGAYQAGKDAELDAAVTLYPEIENFLCQKLNEKIDFSDSATQLELIMGKYNAN